MRITIKVGTNLLTLKDGSLNSHRIKTLAEDILKVKKLGHEIVLVTSGAIGAGMGKIGWASRPSTLKEKQALAAIGQPLLMHIYEECFDKLGLTVAQVLLTRYDFDDRQRYLNARNTILTLLELGIIPIINENDTIAVEEINFGDNDTLAAMVSAKISAEQLIILTDVEGLYKGLPGKSDLISTIEEITPEIEQYASGVSGSGKGVGGMLTKLTAARIATSAGVKMIIANGSYTDIVERIVSGEKIGTAFFPHKHLDARKCWIAFGTKCRGKIIVDAGAAKALKENGKSLLPSGITGVEGEFLMGDTISIMDENKKEIARGLSYYSSDDIEKIKGKKSKEIKKFIPNANYEEIIHRDNLVIL